MASFSVTKKDLEVTWFSGSGAGGQHRNRHRNCCRIRHPETGVIVTGQSHKEANANKKEAIRNLLNHWKFKAFLKLKLDEVEQGQTLQKKCEEVVDELMSPEYIRDVDPKDFRLLTKGKKKETIDGVEIWTP